MALYAVSDTTTSVGTIETVAAALELIMDGITNTKVLRYVDILPHHNKLYQGVVIYDA